MVCLICTRGQILLLEAMTICQGHKVWSDYLSFKERRRIGKREVFLDDDFGAPRYSQESSNINFKREMARHANLAKTQAERSVVHSPISGIAHSLFNSW